MICDPWGSVVAQTAAEGDECARAILPTCFLFADCALRSLSFVRSEMCVCAQALSCARSLAVADVSREWLGEVRRRLNLAREGQLCATWYA